MEAWLLLLMLMMIMMLLMMEMVLVLMMLDMDVSTLLPPLVCVSLPENRLFPSCVPCRPLLRFVRMSLCAII